MSYRKKLGRIVTDFLQVESRLKTFRNRPTDKQRKYRNIEITEDFKRIDEQRQKQRFLNIKKKKQLLEFKMKEDNLKLLSTADQQLITKDLKQLQELVAQHKNQLAQLDAKIDELEPEYLLIEGYKKKVVLNYIKYLEYQHDHNPGYILHPETMQAMENIHYCLNHNLPVNRIKLYQLIPDMFQAQIGQLQESVQKLIKEKQLYSEEDNAHIRFFGRERRREQKDIYAIMEKKQANWVKTSQHFMLILSEHKDLLKKVAIGQTPFRSIKHFHYILNSNFPINLLPEEQKYKNDMQYILEVRDSYLQCQQQLEQYVKDLNSAYIEPPPYVSRNPVLMKHWDQAMVNHTNSVPIQHYLPDGDQTQNLLRDRMVEDLRKIAKEKYDQQFIRLMNTDRSAIDNKKLELEFLNLSTQTMQTLKALPDFSTPQNQEIFQKIDDKRPWLLSRKKQPLIKADELTRMIALNKKDKQKYSVQFFAKWFGIDEQLLRQALNSFSYLRATASKKLTESEKEKQGFQYEIIKFQF